ncbi:O-phosphoserine--tRNA ligase [bacterium]|nr:O-phosphoserine--tRNA ligase [bacterium]
MMEVSLKEETKRERGKEHPVSALSVKLREIFLELGLDEIINPMVVEERDIYLQYGSEAPLILDRVYYLAGVDRADIGLSNHKVEKIKEIIPNFNKLEELKGYLRRFKEGRIEGDDFVEGLVNELAVSEEQALSLIEKVFPEFKELRPVPSKKTLRSHMTALWYSTIAALLSQKKYPLSLFSMGPRFRREQRQDSSHLYESTSASIVIVDENFTLEDGKKITQKILTCLGFSNFEFKIKGVTSNYYAPGTDTEIYAEFGSQKVEVANLGYYSKESLTNYGIKYPVFNLGLGVERLSLLLEKAKDIRELVYPQYLHIIELTDEEIISTLKPCQEPATPGGEKLVKELVEKCLAHKETIGPVEILIYEGDFLGKEIKIWVYNWDMGKSLMSYAYLNKIFVYEGSLYSLPPRDYLKKTTEVKNKFLEVYDKGRESNLSFMDLIMKKFIFEIEKTLAKGEVSLDIKFKMIKRLGEVNLYISDYVNNYITSNNKKILVGGPLFFGLKALLS